MKRIKKPSNIVARPVPKSGWVRVGDRCENILSDWRGDVLRVTEYGSGTQATVRWDNGYEDRITIAWLRKVKKERA